MAYNPFPPGFGNYDPNASANSVNGAVLSVTQPYVESDTASKIGSVFEGVQSVLTTGADVYQRLRYTPEPVDRRGGRRGIRASESGRGGGRGGGTGASAPVGLSMPIVVAGIGVVAFLVLR